MHVLGAGFVPGSTVTFTLHSTPVTLGTVVTNADGTFDFVATIPVGTAAGSHLITADAVNPDGTTVTQDTALSVTTVLASTGTDSSLPLQLGVGLLIIGAGCLVGSSALAHRGPSRRRRR